MSDAAESLRREVEDFDPFGSPQPSTAIASVTLDDGKPPESEPEVTYRLKAGRRGKERRAPGRDISDLVLRYIGERVVEREFEDEHGRMVGDSDVIAEYANLLNVKSDRIERAWRRAKREKEKLSDAERRHAERELEPLRGLAPVRALIGMAYAPHKADKAALEAAAERLAFAGPEVRAFIPDVAFMLDLSERVHELAAKTLPALFDVYKRLVDEEASIRTYVVNYCHNARDTHQPLPEAIYPPLATEE